jgi:hypothetical protein
MPGVQRQSLPPGALHESYARDGAYTDCYVTTIDRAVTHEEFVAAFYTTWLFKLERWILSWTVKKPSTDAQARDIARGAIHQFAAWTEEARTADQLLMCDFLKHTRSWFRVSHPSAQLTVLFFGSVVTSRMNPVTGQRELGRGYRALLGFHQLYSRALLAAARSRLSRAPRSLGRER